MANILQQGRYACHRDSRGCKGFYACVQNVTGTRPFRMTVQEVTRQHGCRAIDDCHDAWDEPFRSMVVLSDRELPLKHQACHAKKGSHILASVPTRRRRITCRCPPPHKITISLLKGNATAQARLRTSILTARAGMGATRHIRRTCRRSTHSNWTPAYLSPEKTTRRVRTSC